VNYSTRRIFVVFGYVQASKIQYLEERRRIVLLKFV